jgi:hypothetical protein
MIVFVIGPSQPSPRRRRADPYIMGNKETKKEVLSIMHEEMNA